MKVYVCLCYFWVYNLLREVAVILPCRVYYCCTWPWVKGMYQKLRREISQITRKYLLTKHSTGDLNTVLYVWFYVVMPDISRLTMVSPEVKAVRNE